MPRANVKDKRKQQLMEANIASIAKRGLSDTTIEHVSKGANMSRGIVNFYFTSKEKMMLETLSFLTEEFTAAWQTASKSAGDAVSAQVEAIIKSLLGDKLCSSKRLAVFAAFIGHAGTHKHYAKIICDADALLAGHLTKLFSKSDDKTAKQRANQIVALIHGHWLANAVGADDNKPSVYSADWVKLVTGTASAAPAIVKAAKPEKKKAVAQSTAPEQKKIKKPELVKKAPTQPQLAIGDLFG